ncbi:hypothetical protein RY27_17955, partial [Litorilinea aerophila]
PLKRGMAQDTFPSKIYTIMAAARPVVAAADPDTELAWVVEQAGCGWVVPPEDVHALAQAIERAYQERGQAAAMGQSGREYVVEHHARPSVVRRYHELITALTGRPS